MKKLLLLLFFATPVLSQPVSLGDLEKNKKLKSIPYSVQSGSKIFFNRTTDAHGSELWVTDGTPAGTKLVKDIVPGAEGSEPKNFHATTIGGTTPGAYFLATTAAQGTELWITDGTAVGTKLVKDINPGSDSGFGSGLPFGEFIAIPAPSNFAVFSANNGVNGFEPWVTNGTEAGTQMITDIYPGIESSNPENLTFISEVGYVLFSATTPATGREPYITNGVASLLLSDLQPGANSSEPNTFVYTPTNLLFHARNSTTGGEVYQSDFGTTGVLKDIAPGNAPSLSFGMTAIGPENVIFNHITDESFQSIKVYKTNGTNAGTNKIADLNCLPGGVFAFLTGFEFPLGRVINNKVVFSCFNVKTAESEPWVSDGNTVSMLKNIAPGIRSSETYGFYKGNNRVVFPANDGKRGYELWTSNGTEAGTRILSDFSPGEKSSFDPLLATLPLISVDYNTTASIIPVTQGTERKVIYTDGTSENTRVLFDDSAAGTVDSNPREFTAVGKRVIFTARDTSKEQEIFVSNGKKAGTKILRNIYKSGSSNPRSLQKFSKEQAVFAANDPKRGVGLWITDGTKLGTNFLKKIDEKRDLFFSSYDIPKIFAGKVKNRMFISGRRDSTGIELWVTQGTKASTKLLRDIYEGEVSSEPDHLVVVNKKAIFAATDGVNGRELWVSNGTKKGTKLLKDIAAGLDGSYPNSLTVMGNKAFFIASTAATGDELWVTDGTPDGTVLLKDIRPGAQGSVAQRLVVSGAYLFFTANDGVSGIELWRSDGTSAGTVRVSQIGPGASNSSISELTPLGEDSVIFNASSAGFGDELWIANSGVGSEQLLKDIYVGALGSSPRDFYSSPNRKVVFFAASTLANGTELWRTDGTTVGTIQVADLCPGSKGSHPEYFFMKGKRLFFAADNCTTGIEPYVLKVN